MAVMWQTERRILADAGVVIAPGLTAAELARAEASIGAKFPPDLGSFLAAGLPLGKGCPDWREPDSEAIRHQLDWPFEGMAFDIEHNAFWWSAWGARPQALDAALELARERVADAPRLIPLMGHRYLPAEPDAAGNPVFSVHQTDIILYGDDLGTYLRCEFNQLSYAEAVSGRSRRIRFWSDLVDGNA